MRRVAAITQEWRAHLQHAFSCCTMRVMAIGAVIIHGFVAVHKGPAFFHVAGVAGFIDAIALHEFGAN